MSKTRTQRALLNWRWWVCLTPVMALMAFVAIPWGILCAVKAGAEAFAEEWLDPPFPAQLQVWLNKMVNWVKEGGQG